MPDLTLIIDIDVDTGLARARHRNQRTQDVETRLDEQSPEFHQKVRHAYHHLAEDEPKRVRLIDGSRPEVEVAQEVWAAVEALLSDAKRRLRK